MKIKTRSSIRLSVARRYPCFESAAEFTIKHFGLERSAHEYLAALAAVPGLIELPAGSPSRGSLRSASARSVVGRVCKLTQAHAALQPRRFAGERPRLQASCRGETSGSSKTWYGCPLLPAAFQAMVELGKGNSRMKDFSRHPGLSRNIECRSVTFEHVEFRCHCDKSVTRIHR
ncbi:MAG: hypothetical protein WB783_05010 [Arenicellales bacterium]|jgi:hypothetical protein